MNQNLPATSIALLLTAERLFACEGIDAVSTRRIAQEANQRNVSALQYHFGSKDNLIDALLTMRLETINARRQTLLDPLDATSDFHQLLMALVLPLVEQLEEADSHFVGCLYQLYLRARGDRVYSNLPPEYTAALTKVTKIIERRMSDLPAVVRFGRLRLMGSQLIHSVGDWYYQRERGEDLAPVAELAGTLVDFLAGGLLAPVTQPSTAVARQRRRATKTTAR
jgi:AcrR family transcriptional regulator